MLFLFIKDRKPDSRPRQGYPLGVQQRYNRGLSGWLYHRSIISKYHHLHPQYIFSRFEKLGKNYDNRILLILCDVVSSMSPFACFFLTAPKSEHQSSIKELTKEVGQYLATYKLYEFKSHQIIKERVDNDYQSVLRAALTTVRGVNKTDVMTLKTNFGSFSNIAHAATEDMQLCPGFGPTKVRRLYEAFNRPFYSSGQKPVTLPLDSATDGNLSSDPIPISSQARDIEGSKGSDPPRFNISTRPDRSRIPSPEWDIMHISTQRPDINLELSLELNPSDDDTLSGNSNAQSTLEKQVIQDPINQSRPNSKKHRPHS
ncbi:Rad10 domain-containing protein [Rhizoctonia solani AG-1 IA]|uniref:Rad10 domain-containing protein n=1 Tax=Thanatephorus cucumeris (strain AG1-IA) TaxID=983506 RepID=L8WVS0_THACA|nr:Rad10 domain-containing protein [Rhizoctonia solani AG-1 IA]